MLTTARTSFVGTPSTPLPLPSSGTHTQPWLRRASAPLLRLCTLLLTAGVVFATVPGVQAQTADHDKLWTTVGSDGTLDETAVGKVFFDRSVVQMGQVPIATQTTTTGTAASTPNSAVSTVPSESAVIRYNVTPVDGLFPGPNDSHVASLNVRYLATGLSARVVAKLIEVDFASGVETVLLTFKSDAFPGASFYHEQGVSNCGQQWHFDFQNKGYYIEATLTHSALVATSAAGIQMIKLEQDPCLF